MDKRLNLSDGKFSINENFPSIVSRKQNNNHVMLMHKS